MRKHYDWYRHPRTTAEKRANQEGWERPKRRPHLLPDTYDDKRVTHTKSWKDHRRTQYHTNGRGRHHSIVIPYKKSYHLTDIQQSKINRITNYCQDHNIPYRIQTVSKFHWLPRFTWRRLPQTETVKPFEDSDWTYQINKWEKVYDGTYYRQYYVDYYVFHWWYNKDIGVDKI